MTILLPGPGGGRGGGKWEEAWRFRPADEATQSLSPDGNYYFQGLRVVSARNAYDRLGISIINGQGIRLAPNASAVEDNCPGFQIVGDTTVMFPVDEWGYNPPIRVMTKFYSYAGAGGTDCCAGGLLAQRYDKTQTGFARLAGLCWDGSPAVYITNDASNATKGVFTAETDVDGYLYWIIEMPSGFWSQSAVIRCNTTENFDTAAVIGICHRTDNPIAIIDMTNFAHSQSGNTPFYSCMAGFAGSSNAATYIIEEVIAQGIRQI